MVGAVHRLRSLIDKKGEQFSVGVISHRGVFAIISHAQARIYATEASLSGANTPIYSIMVRDDDTTLVTDTISWAGLSLGVHAITKRRLFSNTLFKVIIAS